jgi:hypothetical protein
MYYHFRVLNKRTFKYFYYSKLPNTLLPKNIGMELYEVTKINPPIKMKLIDVKKYKLNYNTCDIIEM